MKQNTKYKLIRAILACFITLLLLALFSYLSGPSTDTFEWSSINPATAIAGIVFTFAWIGLPTVLAIGVTGLILFLLIYILCRLLEFIFWKKENKKPD